MTIRPQLCCLLSIQQVREEKPRLAVGTLQCRGIPEPLATQGQAPRADGWPPGFSAHRLENPARAQMLEPILLLPSHVWNSRRSHPCPRTRSTEPRPPPTRPLGGTSICKAVHQGKELKLDLSRLPGVIRVQIKTRTQMGVANTL